MVGVTWERVHGRCVVTSSRTSRASALRLVQPAEVHDRPYLSVGAGGNAGAHDVVVPGKDVGAMSGRVHPGLFHRGCGRGVGTVEKVLAEGPEGGVGGVGGHGT